MMVPGPVDEPEVAPELLPPNPPALLPTASPPSAGSSSVPDWLAQLHPISAPQRTAAARVASMRLPTATLTGSRIGALLFTVGSRAS